MVKQMIYVQKNNNYMYMNSLPEDILWIIYKNVHKFQVIPELKKQCVHILVINCIKENPYAKTLSYITNSTNLRTNTVYSVLNSNPNVLKIYNNLYNTLTYFHKDQRNYV
jgi:hypothetical protein